jgi:acyl carrier protein
VLDSLGLVRVIAELEDEIYDHTNKSITLADEKAMSQKASPFRSVASLSDYISTLLHEVEP